MSVDLEALEKHSRAIAGVLTQAEEMLISEVRALRAERDALKGRPGEIQSLRDDIAKLLNSETRLQARVAELERLGTSVCDAIGYISHNNQWGIYQAVEAWRKAVRG